jgi:hypothetical protein
VTHPNVAVRALVVGEDGIGAAANMRAAAVAFVSELSARKTSPMPPTAISCTHKEMVRRGSTVRVRQRALY